METLGQCRPSEAWFSWGMGSWQPQRWLKCSCTWLTGPQGSGSSPRKLLSPLLGIPSVLWTGHPEAPLPAELEGSIRGRKREVVRTRMQPWPV